MAFKVKPKVADDHGKPTNRFCVAAGVQRGLEMRDL